MDFLLIAGSRDYNDKETFSRVLDGIIANTGMDIIIIEGAAQGVDSLARDYAMTHRLPLVEFPADWKSYGRAAGPKRNDQMIDYTRKHSGKALFFWDGKSKGTAHCICSARRKGIDIMIWNTTERRFVTGSVAEEA